MTDTPTKTQRRQAYRNAREASERLDAVAESLGYDSMMHLADAGRDGDLPADLETGVKEVTNAYSYLNRGSVHKLLPKDDYE